MLTASGDQTVALWDTAHADQLASFRGHSGSVKAVCPLPAAPAVFASGARRGRGLGLLALPACTAGCRGRCRRARLFGRREAGGARRAACRAAPLRRPARAVQPATRQPTCPPGSPAPLPLRCTAQARATAR